MDIVNDIDAGCQLLGDQSGCDELPLKSLSKKSEPSIVERIDQDLELHAKNKKLLRLVDEQFLASQTPDLPELQLQLRELKLDNVELETGRPRTDAYIVYLFLMLRGFNGGCKDQHARSLLQESITLDHAQTLARASWAGIAARQHPQRESQRGEQPDPQPNSSAAIAFYFARGSG